MPAPVDTLPPPTLEAAMPASADGATELILWSNGQPWDEERAIRVIQHELEQIILSANRIGRVLLHARAVLGHGGFQEWVERCLPFSTPTARRYMQVAEFFSAHPKLAEPLSTGRLRNVLLLTSLPAELEQSLAEDGGLAQVPAEELGRMPYAQLRQLKEKLEAEVSAQRTRAERAESTLSERNELLVRATTRQIGDQRAARTIEVVGELRSKVTKLMGQLGFELDLAAQNWEELTPEAQAEVAGLIEWVETWIRTEKIRHELLRGGDTPGYLLGEVLAEPRTLKSSFVIPADRDLPSFGG